MTATIDGHVHFWDARHTPQPWMTQHHAAIARPFSPAELAPLLRRNGIDAVIAVQGACLDSDTDYLFAEAARHDWIGAVTAWLPLDRPLLARRRLDAIGREPKLRAVRHLIHHEPDHWLARPEVVETLALLQERDIILECPAEFPRHFDDIDYVAARLPALRIVIDHLGKPPVGSGQMDAWEAMVRGIARHPNVMAKVSGLNTTVPHPGWSAQDWARPVRVALDSFGPGRLMCGSDWPVCLLNGQYDRVWGETRKAAEAVITGSADELLGASACRIYQLEVPARGA